MHGWKFACPSSMLPNLFLTSIIKAYKCPLYLFRNLFGGKSISFNCIYLIVKYIAFLRGLHAYHCLAFSYTIHSQIEDPAESHIKQLAMLLTAAALWFLKGLHCVPDSGPASRDLIAAILPHVQREDADPNALPFVMSTQSHNNYDSKDEMSSDFDSDAPPQRL